MLKTIAAMLLTFKKVFQSNVLPQLVEGSVPLFKVVEVGKVSDPSAAIEYPALYIFRGTVEAQKLALNNVAQPRSPYFPNSPETYMQLYVVPITFELLAESLLQWEQLADTVARVVLTLKPVLLSSYKLHDFTNPVIGSPEVQERGNKVWVGQISFTAFKQARWSVSTNAPPPPLLEEVIVEPHNLDA